MGRPERTKLAVMCDTFHPLKLSKLAKDLDDGKYAYSWYEEPRARSTRTTRIRRGQRRTYSPAGPVAPRPSS